MKKAIVTGGLGFIGSHLCERLLEEGYFVTVIDNEVSSVIGSDFFKSNNITVHVDDVFSALHFLEESDVFFHLASPVGPVGVLDYAGRMGYEILRDVVGIIDYCKRNKSMLINISTSEIYGHSDSLDEDSKKVFKEYKVRTEYGASKMVAEIAINGAALVSSDLRYHTIRPFNVSGPRQKPNGGFVLPRFVVAALTDQPITIYGDGLQRRAFTDVKDICNSIFEISVSSYKNEIWNIGNPQNEMNIRELAWLVADTVGKGEIISVDPKDIHGDLFSEPGDKVPNSDKISSLLGWKPQVSLEETIKSTVEYYESKIKEGYYFKVI